MSGYILKTFLHFAPMSWFHQPKFTHNLGPPLSCQNQLLGSGHYSHIPEPNIKLSTTAKYSKFSIDGGNFPLIQENNQNMGNAYITVCIQCGQIWVCRNVYFPFFPLLTLQQRCMPVGDYRKITKLSFIIFSNFPKRPQGSWQNTFLKWPIMKNSALS